MGRINVAFLRAKQFMAIFTSIRLHQITNAYNRGVGCLKNYLRYAKAMSLGDVTRPNARLVPYSTPLKSVFTCSASTPPGGGVHGMCGYFAAQDAVGLRRLSRCPCFRRQTAGEGQTKICPSRRCQ